MFTCSGGMRLVPPTSTLKLKSLSAAYKDRDYWHWQVWDAISDSEKGQRETYLGSYYYLYYWCLSEQRLNTFISVYLASVNQIITIIHILPVTFPTTSV